MGRSGVALSSVTVLPRTSSLVGREDELTRVLSHLREALSGDGGLILVEGEAGVGKTRLLGEVRSRVAQMDGATTVLQGRCIEGTTPYHAFIEALQSVGSKEVLGSESGRIREIFLIHRDGRLLAHYSEGGRELDQDLVSGMLTAIRDFIEHSFRPGSTGSLNELQYGGNHIAMEEGETAYIAAVISPPAPAWVRESVSSCLAELEQRYGTMIRDWHGKRSPEIIAMENRLVALAKELPSQVGSLVDRSRRLEEIATRLEDLCSRAPVVLLLDDLQWMDDASLDLLHHVSRRAQDLRMLVVATYRPEDLVDLRAPQGVHPLTRALRRLSRENLYAILKLRRLSADQTRSMVNQILPANILTDELFELLHRTTDGNPFFVVEILAQLVEDGRLVQEAGVWSNAPIIALALPTTVRDVVLRRVDRLRRQEQDLLNLMAVAGLEFDFPVIQLASGLQETDLIDSLDTLVRLRLLQESAGEDHYRFDHELFREVLYDRLSRGTRRLLHHKIGEALEQVHRDDNEEVIFELAYHFSQTRDEERSLQYSILAGERALRAFAPQEAISHFERVLANVEGNPASGLQVKAAELHNYLGTALDSVGDQRAALEHFSSALTIVEKLELPRVRATVQRNLGRLYQKRADWPRAMENLQRALEGFTALGNDRGRGDTHRALAQVFWQQGEYAMAKVHLEEALAIQDRLRNRAEMGAIYTDLANIDASKGQSDQARGRYEEALHLLDGTGDLAELARAYNNLATLEQETGHSDRAARYYERCNETAQRIGDRRSQAFGLLGLTELQVEGGELAAAQDNVVEGMALAEQLNDRLLLGDFHRVQGTIFGHSGQSSALDEHFAKAEALFEMVNAPFEVASLHLLWAQYYLRTRDLVRARDLIARSRQRAQQIGARQLVARADALAAEGERSRGAESPTPLPPIGPKA